MDQPSAFQTNPYLSSPSASWFGLRLNLVPPPHPQQCIVFWPPPGLLLAAVNKITAREWPQSLGPLSFVSQGVCLEVEGLRAVPVAQGCPHTSLSYLSAPPAMVWGPVVMLVAPDWETAAVPSGLTSLGQEEDGVDRAPAACVPDGSQAKPPQSPSVGFSLPLPGPNPPLGSVSLCRGL